jgi:type III secretion system YscJ/HrcJ family lipoprotein
MGMTASPQKVALGCCSIALLLFTLGCAKEELVHQLTEFEANQIVSVLEHKGVKATKEKEEGGRIITYKVVVGAAEAMNGRRILVDNRLPPPRAEGLMKIYDPANKGLIPTATEERAAYQMALQGEVVQKIKTIPGIVEVHVTINKPEKDIVAQLEGRQNPATASVVITYNTIDNNVPFKTEDIQKLVAGCVEGLAAENVTVLATRNRPTDQAVLERDPHESDVAAMGSVRIWGINVADDAGKKRLTTMLMLGSAFSAVILLAFLLTLVSTLAQKKKLSQISAQLVAAKKAARPLDAPPVQPG